MPKRIPHLAETILEKAQSLFSERGYASVDMKEVAAKAGTSVGNLYNYFPSKPALFLAIHSRWRKDLLSASQEILGSDRPRRDKILAMLRRLYDDVASWKELWKEFMGGSDARAQIMAAKAKEAGPARFGWLDPDEQALLAEIETLLTGQPSPDPAARWAFLVVSATIQLAARLPEQREDNWKFLETLVDKI
jgi:AcrR family transcriptional regulator